MVFYNDLDEIKKIIKKNEIRPSRLSDMLMQSIAKRNPDPILDVFYSTLVHWFAFCKDSNEIFCFAMQSTSFPEAEAFEDDIDTDQDICFITSALLSKLYAN